MSYEKQIWTDGVSPLNAERMNHMEEGIHAVAGAVEELKQNGAGGNVSTDERLVRLLDCFEFGITGGIPEGKPASSNLLNPDEIVTGKYITPTTGVFYDNASYSTTGFIPVNAGDIVTFQADYDVGTPTRQIREWKFLAAFDANKQVVADAGSSSAIRQYTVPDGISFVRLSWTSTAAYYNLAVNLLDEWPDGSSLNAVVPYEEYYEGETGTTTGKNLLNPATITHGVYPNWTNGTLTNNANCSTSDYIKVAPGDVLVGSWVNVDGQNLAMKIRYHCFYDADKNFVAGSGTVADTVVVPDGVTYVRVGIYTSTYNTDSLQIEKNASGTFTPFEPYGTSGQIVKLSEDVIVPEVERARGGYDSLADRLDAMAASSLVLNLPAKLYALVGEELNIYFDNLVDGHDTDYSFDVTCSVGMQMERCYRLIAETAGSYAITISATDKNGATVEKSSTIIVSDTSAGNGATKSLIVLGDSTTNNGIAITKLNENFSGDAMNVTTLGTRGTSPNNHEGRSGWTFAKYFTTPGDDSVMNPFYNPDTQTFDASYYFTNSGVSIPDWFFINLGINDTFGLADDSALANTIVKLNDYCDQMVTSLRAVAPNTKIGVCLTIPPNYSQDAFGKAYKCGQTRKRYKRNNVLWVQNQIERYDGREAENIYLVPIYTNLDTKYNMGMEQIQHNKRNTEKYASPIGNGGVHPVESGYWQIADIYWFFLKNQA